MWTDDPLEQTTELEPSAKPFDEGDYTTRDPEADALPAIESDEDDDALELRTDWAEPPEVDG